MPTRADLVTAITVLHREKDRAYGPAWKRRGELVSIIANIARKVDRIERLVDHEASPRDESAFDTAVDLFVYCLKYQTYLADIDGGVADGLFSGRLEPPYSDGPEGFEVLLDHADLSALEQPAALAPAVAAASVVAVFASLEDCLAVDGSTPGRRQARAADLAMAAITLVAALGAADPSAFDAFLAAWDER